MTDREAFVLLLRELGANFNREITATVARTYWQHLDDVADDEFATAVRLAISMDKFWPTVARLRELVRPEANPRVDGARVFGEIGGCTIHNEHTGTYVSARIVGERLGPVARIAFEALGGRDAWKEGTPTHRLRDFQEVYEQQMAILARDNVLGQVRDQAARAISSTNPRRLPA